VGIIAAYHAEDRTEITINKTGTSPWIKKEFFPEFNFTEFGNNKGLDGVNWFTCQAVCDDRL
jgi:hypothetical protein